jgi:hypothetical protein
MLHDGVDGVRLLRRSLLVYSELGAQADVERLLEILRKLD